MAIKEIAFTCYPVNDLFVSRKFYEEVLGLKSTNIWSADEKTGFVEYDIGNGTFAIGAGADHFKPSNNGACVAFEVDDFNAMIKRLKSFKIPFITEPHETSVCHMAIVVDPDNTKIMIHKRKDIHNTNS